MVGVGEMLAAAVVKEVAGKLLAVASAAAGGPVKTMWRFKDDLEEMTETLKFVEAGIRDAERRSVKDEVARLWLKRLKKTAYDISDMFDEFEANSPPRIWSKIMSSGNMAIKMKKMNKRLKTISEQRKRYETERVDIPVYEQHKIAEKRETTSRMGSDVIVGRRHEKEAVINILLSINNKAAATSTVNSPLEMSNCALIYGLGGVGKTELAKLVFNDERIREDFPLRAWVYLHQNFEVNDIGRAIICEVEGGVCELKTRQSINRHLEKVLSSRCLVVLDNLWDSLQLTDLEGILGSKVSILVTSRRNWKWAKIRSFHLEPLSEKFGLDLVKQVASSYFLEGDIPEDVMKAIVEMCKGVPLAVKTVASLLKPERGGKELLGIINRSFEPELCHGITAEQTVIESLKLTYHCMKPHIKLCFAYCAIFPKGCEINREDLYHQWIALDLIQGSPMIKKMFAAEDNVHELLDMSFLQDSGPSSVIKSSGVPAKLKMHDLVHDLAMLVADDELVVMDRENIECTFDGPRHALFVACEKPDLHKRLPAGLRALHFKDCPRLKIEWYNFSLVKCLRILNISGCCVEKLPSSIVKLMKLRYLNASGIQSEELPKAIGTLSELQYLNLHGSSISALPESTSKLGHLMHLDLSGCVNLRTLPKSFSALERLSLLNLENCSQLCSLPDDLAKLKNLENLNLSGCSSLDMLPESLGELEYLKQLDLSGCKKLVILPNSISRLTSLQYLNMSSCSELDIPVDALTKLVKLKYVNMSSSPKLLGLPEEFCTLKHLHTLNLSGCSKLTNLPERLAHMNSIRFILLDGCAESVRKPILQHRLGAGLQSLPAFVVETEVDSIRSNISQLEQEKFSELELYRLEKVRTVDEAKALKMLDRSGLQSLGLMWTLNIHRFVEDEALLKTLEPPEDLQKFRVQGYMGEKFPKWKMEIGSYRRGQLDEVALMHFPMCNSLPLLGQLANLEKLHLSRMPKIRRLGRELCGDTGAFKKLEKFTLEYMENLGEWCTTMPSASGPQQEGFMFPALQELNIYHCPRLTMQPCPPRSINWEIRASDGAAQLLLKRDEVMRSLAEYTGMGRPFAYTTELHVSDSSSSSPSPTDGWKFHGSLITLKDLTCDSCSLIDTLLGKGSSMQCLVNLEISGVEHVRSLQEQVETVAYSTRSGLAKSWPDLFSQPVSTNDGASLHFIVTGHASCVLPGWINEVTSFLGNLIRINMDDLPMCDGLPPLGQLPRLQELRLKGMPKIRRIDRDFCGGERSSSALFFPRLTRFVLNGMPNLEELVTKVSAGSDHDSPEEFMFPRLVKLAIWNCPKLKLRPCPPRAAEWDINNSDQLIASSYDINSGGELATTLQVLLCKVPPNGWELLRHLPRLQNLAIVSCHEMKALPESVRSLSSLQSLAISKCHGLKHLPEWLGDLTSLEKLTVVSCPMEFLPGSLRRLAFLRSLSLSCCDGMAALPGWLGDLISLQKLTIEGCNSLKSLPQLTKLEDLLIEYNDELKQWCDSEVNKAKFAHMRRKGFWLDSPSRSNSYMLPARSLVILWAYDDRYWRWHSVPESRFAESVELLEVWWLVIEGRVPAEALSADTSYDVYLVYKLADEHDGLRWGESSVCVDGEDATRAFVSLVDEDAVRVDGVAYPVTRSEGWMELRLGEFHSKRGDSEVKMIVWEKTDTFSKKGLIIEGMEIRAKSLATS